jgi:hypothetical protein
VKNIKHVSTLSNMKLQIILQRNKWTDRQTNRQFTRIPLLVFYYTVLGIDPLNSIVLGIFANYIILHAVLD